MEIKSHPSTSTRYSEEFEFETIVNISAN